MRTNFIDALIQHGKRWEKHLHITRSSYSVCLKRNNAKLEHEYGCGMQKLVQGRIYYYVHTHAHKKKGVDRCLKLL